MSQHGLSAGRNAGPHSKTALILSWISLFLMIVESAIGLFVPGVYAKDSTWGRTVFLGNDLVNLCLFAPVLFIAIILYRRGADRGRVFWLGIQALVTYDYVYYPLGVAYDRFFLLYVAALGVSLYSFLFGLQAMDIPYYQRYVPAKRPRVAAAVLMLVFAAVFVVMWVGQWLSYLISGVEGMQGLAMISTFDLLTLMVPLVLSSVWLLRGEGRGYVFSVVMSLVCGMYPFILIAYTPYALKAGLPDAWTMLPLWIFLLLIGLAAAVLLLSGRPETPEAKYRD